MNLQQQFAAFSDLPNHNIHNQKAIQDQQNQQQRMKQLRQQQQMQYLNLKSANYNLNQSAILFGNITGIQMNQHAASGNSYTPTSRLNQSFNFVGSQTHREVI